MAAAVFSSLKTLFKNQNPNRKNTISLLLSLSSSFHASAIPLSSPLHLLSLSPLSTFSPSLLSSHSTFISPFRTRWIPFSGPLFLSSPPWKLLQLATPLYLRGELVLLRKAESLNLLPKRNFPIKLGFGSVGGVEDAIRIVDARELRERGGGAVVEGFANLPNLISLSRMVSGPVLGWMILNEWYLSSFVGLAISGATDWLDGFVARKMGINSVIGSYLDPLADKVLIGCVAVTMVKMDLLHPGLVGLVVLRDVGLVSGAVYKRACALGWEWKSLSNFINLDQMRPEKVEPLFLSKVNTVFQLVLVAAALLQPEFGTSETQSYITYLSWLVASTTVASSVAYGVQHMQNGSISATKILQSVSKTKSC
eukprot:TRINITY_DN11415_c0_g1_i5.p1 TRINITY_DN11415_c0_g1~~TRINITY_DN11415_c0_g1_i5.p1  ORF type:complete len:378 (+),score=87.88 TRINITY_DN11415_c0_g1_i5:35-1135(+)